MLSTFNNRYPQACQKICWSRMLLLIIFLDRFATQVIARAKLEDNSLTRCRYESNGLARVFCRENNLMSSHLHTHAGVNTYRDN